MEPHTTSDPSPLIDIVRRAGLTESQAKGYLALIEYAALSPTDLAEKTGETRTNGYMICDKLEKLGLATKKPGKKALYTPNHPSALEALAEKRRKAMLHNEQEVKNGLASLIDLFYAMSELPSTRTLQGIAGIKEVYADTLREKQDIFLVRTTYDIPDLGQSYLDTYRTNRAIATIHTYALTPETEIGIKNQASGEDEKMLFHRTFLPKDSYTAPVEIDVYGNKVALIAFGDTQMATIIDSPAIAEAMRQLLRITISALTKH